MLLSQLPKSASIQAGPDGTNLGAEQLIRSANARASALMEMGLAPGKRLAIVPSQPTQLLIDIFAAWQCNAVPVCLAPALPPTEIASVQQSIRPDVWSLPTEVSPPPNSPTLLPADPSHQSADAPEVTDASADDPALVLMTSGTTSTPKGVVLSHRALLARLALNIAHIPSNALKTSLCLLPLHFGHGLIGNTLTPLIAGGRVILWPDAGLAGLSRLGPVIDDHGIGFLSSVPAIWQIALRTSPPPKAGNLRRVHIGSAPLSVAQWQAVADWSGTPHIVNMYGMTEAANWIAGHDLAEGPATDGLVGRCWGGALAVRLPDGTVVRSGRGDVLVASPSLMLGYLDQPEQSAASLKDGWLNTGDIGEIDEDGNLRLVGRTKFEINRAGIKIPAEEVDLLLQGHPDIAEACGFAMPDTILGEAVAAAVVVEEERAFRPDDVLEWCRQRIRPDAVPSRLFQVDQLARSDRGKVLRDRVAKQCLANQPGDLAP
ncbi:MAG: class I adenylate-forming enzyme family protein [Pseudomonadota bacterium]